MKLVTEKYNALKANDPQSDLRMCDVPFTRKELREEIGWSETQVRVNLEQLVELGYIGKISGRHGSTFRYVLLDDGKDDPPFTFSGTDENA